MCICIYMYTRMFVCMNILTCCMYMKARTHPPQFCDGLHFLSFLPASSFNRQFVCVCACTFIHTYMCKHSVLHSAAKKFIQQRFCTYHFTYIRLFCIYIYILFCIALQFLHLAALLYHSFHIYGSFLQFSFHIYGSLL